MHKAAVEFMFEVGRDMSRPEDLHCEGSESVEGEPTSVIGVGNEATVRVDERAKMFVTRNNMEPFGACGEGRRMRGEPL